MVFGTVFPEMVMEFAETVTHAVEIGEKEEEWSAEDVRHVAVACRETGEKFGSMQEMLRNALTGGVDVAAFVKQEGPRLARLDKLLLRHSAILAEADRLQALSPETREVVADFEAMGRAMSLFRDLLKEALSKMTTPRFPIDWQRVEEAQAAVGRRETKPFHRTPKLTEN